MTTFDRPTPPTELDREIHEAVDALESRDADTLRAVSSYLDDLAAWKAAEPDDEHRSRAGTRTDPVDGDRNEDETAVGDGLEYPSDVPERASVTIKEIAGTTYRYYQWRDGDRIESKTVRR